MAEMKITKVETIVVNMPMIIEGTVIPKQGGRPRTSMDTLLVRVETDEGVTGWGEGFGHRIFTATKAALDTFIGPMCVGRDPTAITALMDELQRNLAGVGRNGRRCMRSRRSTSRCGTSPASSPGCRSTACSAASPRADLPAYASLLRYGEPSAVTQYVERALKRGYRHIKLHEITVRRSRRRARPPARTSRSWWTATVRGRSARRSRWRTGSAVQLKWLEEPVWPPEDHAGLARVQAQGGIPTAAGENAMLPEFKGMFEAGAITYAQPSVTKVRRRHADAQGDGAGRRIRGHRRAAFRLLRPGAASPRSTASPPYRAAAWWNATTPTSR